MIELNLKQIIKHRDLQIRDQIDMNRVSFLEDVYEGWDPLLIYKVDSKYYLADGYHRITAAERLNLDKVNVEVVEGTFHDALIAAIKANSVHRGMPLTLKERKHAAELLLITNTNWSNVRIAEIAGISDPSVLKIRTGLENQNIIKPTEVRLGKDGVEQAGNKQVVKITTDEIIENEIPPNPWEGKVLCPADSLDILPSEPKEHYDLIVTDPPYFITNREDDSFPSLIEYLKWTSKWLSLAIPLLKPTGRIYICFSYQHLTTALPLMRKTVQKVTKLYPFTFGCPIIWHHPNTISAAHNQKEYKPAYDVVLYWYGPEAPNLIADDAYTGDERGNVWNSDNLWNIAVPQSNFNEGKFHKFQKPLNLIDRIIRGSTRAGDKVLDPFAGSGTTAVACVALGRDYKIIEKNPDCLEIIEQRLTKAYGYNEN